MRGAASLLFVLLWVVVLGCGPASPVAPQGGGRPDFGALLSVAIDREAEDSLSAGPYLDVVDIAVDEPEGAESLAAVLASLDALVLGASRSTPIAYRSAQSFTVVVQRLRDAWRALDGAASEPAPLMKSVIASALQELALYSGEVGGAHAWTARRGCVERATVVGPLDWAPLAGLEAPSPIASSAPLEARYPGVPPFDRDAVPVEVPADACRVPLLVTSVNPGIRAVVVDVKSEEPQPIAVLLTTTGAARVEVGGVSVVRRTFALGGSRTLRMGTVAVSEGWTRVVVRVAQRSDGGDLELSLLGSDGHPLETRAPRVGDVATGLASRPRAIDWPAALLEAPRGGATAESARGLAAATLLATGEGRLAHRVLEPAEGEDIASRPAWLELLYARAIDAADDLPDATSLEQKGASLERLEQKMPEAWEVKVEAANLIVRRRGYAEGSFGALHELGIDGTKRDIPDADPMVLATAVELAQDAGMNDLAEAAFDALADKVPSSAQLADLDRRLHRRVGAEGVAAACEGALHRAETHCLAAHLAQGDFDAAMEEVTRLRVLRRAPLALGPLELFQRVLHGDEDGAIAAYDRMLPAERSMLHALGLAASRGDFDAVKARLRRDATLAADSPMAIPILTRAIDLTEDPARALEREGLSIVARDRQAPSLPGAGTAVLRRVEQYRVEPNGLLSYVLYDLRRVSGTTDVSEGGQAWGPFIEGRGSGRVLRRRIHKKDGRIIEPDAPAMAAQMASDLSQLEQGDYVEVVLQGFSLPSESGQLTIDTPDLLPERTSVHRAEIEVRFPRQVPMSVWSHPLLGKPASRDEQGMQVLAWRLADQGARRIEDGVPRLERGVRVSIGTQTWQNIGRAIGETLRALDERDPFMARFATEAVGEGGDELTSEARLAKVVAHVGKVIKIASGGELSDISALYGGGPQRTTARQMIAVGTGSRSWVLYRTLRELSIDAEIAIAEVEPWSASADFPPHVGRFQHPLVVAHLESGDVWIDADVEGPPLPPGQLSPELRGRMAILATGEMKRVVGSVGEARDEVDIRLSLDARGNAKGTITLLLRGRAAQGLSEMFENVVGSDRREVLRQVVAAWMPRADVDEVKLSSAEGSWEVAIRADISVFGYGRLEGGDGRTWVLPGLEPVVTVYPQSYTGTLGATYASRGGRQEALNIQSSMLYHVHRRIELPAGATVTRAPSDLDVAGGFLTAARKVAVEAGVVIEEYEMSLPTATVPAADYAAFVGSAHAVDDGFQAGVRVEVKP